VQQGKPIEAESTLRPYLVEHPDSADGHFLLGLALFRQIQEDALTGGVSVSPTTKTKAELSLAEFTKGARYRKPSASDLKVVAFDYVLLGAYPDADKWFTRMLDWNPSDPEGWYYLGRTKYNENRFEEAIQAFQRSLALDPRNVKTEDNLGLSYAGLGRFQEAMVAYKLAMEWQGNLLSKDAGPFIDMGSLLLDQNTTAGAIPYLLEAIEIAPRNPKSHEMLGKAYARLERYSSARSELEEALDLAPQNGNLPCMLAPIYRKLHELDKVQLALTRCAALKTNASSHEPSRP
jgi:tetratricopeptide (TPR) repeat protein